MKTYKYMIIALLTLGLAACQQEDDFAPQGGGEQELRIATRSTSDVNAADDFTDDFTLELWNTTTDNAKHETHSMTYTDGTGWNTAKSSILPAHAFAYKGSSVTDISYLDNWDYTVNLQLDQSTTEKLADADVMIATGRANAEYPLYLNFEHVFAKVTFNATLASEFDKKTDKISKLCVMTNAATPLEVTACCSETDETDVIEYCAYVTAGTYTEGSDFVKIVVGEYGEDAPLKAKIPTGGLTLEAGKHYTFNLKVGKDKVTVDQVSTSNIDYPFKDGWNTEEDLK